MKAILVTSLILTFPLAAAENGSVTEPNTSVHTEIPTNETVVDPEILSGELMEPPNIAFLHTPQDYTVGIYDFTAFENVDQTEERITSASSTSEPSDCWAIAPLQLPKNVDLTSMTFFGTDTTIHGGMIMELRRKSLYTNAIETVATLKTFTPTQPLVADLNGEIQWHLYGGTYPHSFSHIYWPSYPMVYHNDRDLSVEVDHTVSSTHTYYLYVYSVGTVEPERVKFWSASFTFE